MNAAPRVTERETRIVRCRAAGHRCPGILAAQALLGRCRRPAFHRAPADAHRRRRRTRHPGAAGVPRGRRRPVLARSGPCPHPRTHRDRAYTPWAGSSVAGSPVMTIAGGQVIAEDGRLLSEPGRGRVLDRAVDPAERREA